MVAYIVLGVPENFQNFRKIMRKYRKQNLKPLEERMWELIMPEPNSGCWLWLGGLAGKGYGIIGKGRNFEGKEYTHRLFYELYKGPIPDGLEIDHKCRVKICCNPDHLESVTSSINKKRHFEKQDKCKNSLHEMTEDNIYWTAEGHRKCRSCYRDKKRRQRERKRNKKIVDRSI